MGRPSADDVRPRIPRADDVRPRIPARRHSAEPGAGAGAGRDIQPDSILSSMTEMLHQMSLLHADVHRISEDGKMLASSHVQMQQRIETLASSSRAGSQVDIVAALAAIDSACMQGRSVYPMA